MSLKDIFKRKNYGSSYYGKGNRPLFNSPSSIPMMPPEEKKTAPVQFTPIKPTEPDWEQRRFELMKTLVAQDRRSVVLGKLRASHKQIAATARALADAAIKELQTHPMLNEDDTGGKEEAGER